MLEEAEEIGRRARRARLRLGMPQADLAAALGKSQGWVSKMERGLIELDRVGLLNQVAAELHVHPNDLIGRPYTSSPEGNQWQVAASSILRELRRYDLAPVFEGRPRPSGQLWQETTRLHRLRDAAANVAIMQVLPDLFREARALAEDSTGHEREEAFAVYAVCCKFAHTSAHALGHPELVAMSCERAAWSARLSGDSVMLAVADWMRVWDMWATADWSDAIALSDRAISSVQQGYDRGEPLAVRAWGALQLRAAMSAARAGRAAEAEDRIAHARTAADRLGEYVGPPVYDRHSLTFSPGNVQIHAISVALEMREQRKALAINRRTPRDLVAGLPNSRQGHHHMDLARAWLWDGNRDKALRELETAERVAPQLIRNHPIARSTLRSIVYAERTATREKLRRMSDRFHLDG
ncbi:helix-turn-helix transcriptional regulator [Streptomyces somaliensis]|uniref:helix-turn-helix domain-containing protein n=1 Tax=Streptomyces somaliensis TaxID=78355 RepID=UPI0020CF0315|nr:helix-turn-helix transcriptional regulator [Streptomyces somaliensis]MCP9944934.1 helix-turn-helix transcriptional regulator [Streptomyces somaliensis]MCP9961843.1 helix-turn-helix transcriptional regulator [Streptomyces somaliensis]MCP9974663.1 helix-turn-helix transcriptional regulator [Streptomyces somaliensis]